MRWFAAKRYGFGWVPCSWQGWLVLAVFLLLYVFVLSSSLMLWVKIACYFLIVSALIVICHVKG